MSKNIETASKNEERSRFLKALMPLIAGDEGKNIIDSYVDRDEALFIELWGKLTDKLLEKIMED